MPMFITMKRKANSVWLAGVDGCPKGWVVAFVRPSGQQGDLRVVCDFSKIVDAPENPKLIVVDMPIGLPSRAGHGGREPERAARAFLKKRKSSVFSVPSRCAIFSETGDFKNAGQREAARKRASKVAKRTSDPPRRISVQSFAIFPKIRELDLLIRKRPRMKRSVLESHPEVAFQLLKGSPFFSSKKTPAGLRARRNLLKKLGIPDKLVSTKSKRGASQDDIVDALICAIVARRKYFGKAESFPKNPKNDGHGIPMAIWA